PTRRSPRSRRFHASVGRHGTTNRSRPTRSPQKRAAGDKPPPYDAGGSCCPRTRPLPVPAVPLALAGALDVSAVLALPLLQQGAHVVVRDHALLAPLALSFQRGQ